MAQPESKRWSAAALGALLVGLGAAFGLRRKTKRLGPAANAAHPKGGKTLPSNTLPGKGHAGKKRPPQMPSRAPDPGKPAPIVDAHPASPMAVDAESKSLGYEVRDTKASTLGIVMLVSVLIIAGSIAGLFALIGQFRARDRAHAPLTTEQQAFIKPPGPPLQDQPLVDIASQRKREGDLLTSYAWADASHTRARIPIERATALVIGKPLDPEPHP